MWKLIRDNWIAMLIFFAVGIAFLFSVLSNEDSIDATIAGTPMPVDTIWRGPSLYMDRTLTGPERELVIYGKELIANTAQYLGPNGSVAKLTNGMNCQNCHLDAGRKPWANNYGAVYSTYPKFRERSGAIESIYKRVNDCMERSLNGIPLDSNSKEYTAIHAYIKWLGKDVAKGQKPAGSGIEKLSYLNRAADPARGNLVYSNNCVSCHGTNGEGQYDGAKMIYPPLWGNHSYNDGAGLYRLSNFAGFVKGNMPFNVASHSNPTLSNEEAWDVAAFVNSQSRPHKDQSKDWPDISKKPVDYPFAPYADGFNEQQHKFGPFKPIVNRRDSLKILNKAIAKK